MWQAVAAVAALVTALAGGGVGVAGFIRSGQTREEERQRAEVEREVTRRIDATQVGLSFMEKALAAQQETITRQEGEIGKLQGQLVDCRTERQQLAEQIADLRRKIQ